MKTVSAKTRLIVLFIFLFYAFGYVRADANGKRYWIFFKDKENRLLLKESVDALSREIGLSDRSLKRRAKLRERDALLDETDLPVKSEYIQTIEALGLKKHSVSRWLNAVTAEIPENRIDLIKMFPFVKEIKPVSRYPIYDFSQENPLLEKSQICEAYALDYGYSYMQNQLIHIPDVHRLGITGKNVLIGVLDTGFDYHGRSVFSRLKVVAEYDFHWDDEITANEANDDAHQHDHGTEVLSVLGGFHDGDLIGPAYNASYALAKTEWIPVTDDTLEEDHWVEGIEWLEALGVDIVTSSLAYYHFVNGPDYTYSDLDGNTCEVTVAADIAAKKGVIVVSSAGNEGHKSWQYITPPADGDSVIAVGAVTMNDCIWYNSSTGPTADGRIKPEVVAMGVGVYAVNPDRTSASKYVWVTGTSVACPLVSGVCAMVLEAHPELTPIEVRDAIRNTADRADHPDDQYGWGLVNAYEAIFYHGIIVRDFKYVENPLDQGHSVEFDILSRHGIQSDSVAMFYLIPGSETFQKIVPDHLGNEESLRYKAVCPFGFPLDSCQFYISAIDLHDSVYVAPYGAPDVLYSFSDQYSNSVVISDQNRSMPPRRLLSIFRKRAGLL
jgi:serine protease AprX